MGAKIPSKLAEAKLKVHYNLMNKYVAEGLSRENASTRAYDEITSGIHNKDIKNCEKILSGRR